MALSDSKKFTLIIAAFAVGLGACGTEEAATKDTLPEEVTVVTTDSTTTTVEIRPVDEDYAETELSLQPLFNLTAPMDLAIRTGDDSLWFAERDGVVSRVGRSVIDYGSRGRNGIFEAEFFQIDPVPVLDIRSKVTTDLENGLLGLEFSPNGNELYVSYTTEGTTVVSRFNMVGNVADANSEQILLTLDQPADNHNGGQIMTGPDGFLYIALGDGGADSSTAQDRQNLLGSILRIDPESSDSSSTYSIPSNNPFVDSPELGLPEIWLNGVRNPWRFSFDSATGDLWVADVGASSFEEINRLPATQGVAGKGLNLGWDVFEGTELMGDADDVDGHVIPIFEYETSAQSCAVVGGHVYRGELISNRVDGLIETPLDGVYIYGDFCSPSVMSLAQDESGEWQSVELDVDRELNELVSIGNVDNELYFMELDGTVSRLDRAESYRTTDLIPSNSVLPGSGTNSDIEVLPGNQVTTATTRG